ncbi:hypothetical protein BU26DRAFT_522573 [Trematosphaeria pertusa]|uniref:Uncharacterized protein n=1 Tax=Trematosphaeria pertusa TaxID=390896 RepID=A0A6A6I2Y2_9PLEO|nr:uncharacterized protein BU26DRAFT_522573 [Trematosphaeria pertusa]KAF2244835.1 hypothetical protein BU26DRAFT_522573 [Trematosphaeria pertusa]
MAFLRLDTDIVLEILEYVADNYPATLKSLSLVNKALNNVTQSIKHRNKRYTFAHVSNKDRVVRNTELICGWMSDARIVRGIRNLTIAGNPVTSDPPVTPTEIAHVVKLITKVGGLKRLDWRAWIPIPLEVLDALHIHQRKAELRVIAWVRASQDLGPDDEAELALAHSPALTYFHASVEQNYRWSNQDTRDATVHRIIATAPNLQTVYLRTSEGVCCQRCRREKWTPQQVQAAADLSETFYEGLKRSTSIRQLTAYGDLDDFVEAYERLVDLTKLECVSFKYARTHTPAFFNEAPALLQNIKHLHLDLLVRKKVLDVEVQDTINAALSRYLTQSCPRLEVLDLWSKPSSVPLSGILTRHGSTLEHLSLHHREKLRGPPRQSLSTEDIALVKKSATKLSHLSFDIQRRSPSLVSDLEHYKPLFAALSELKLRTLTIHMDLGLEFLGYLDWKEPIKGFNPRFLPPSNTREWAPASREPYAPETDDTNIAAFVEPVWRSVFGCLEEGVQRQLKVHFEEWDYWWRIQGGRRVNVKDETCMRALWVAEGGARKGEDVKVEHVRSVYGRGNEYRVAPYTEFIG